jgi:3-hydroxyethyl bacteriochlorophyllide a dehydrogenase
MDTKAIVMPAAGQVEVRRVALKPLGPDDVLIRTSLTSISAGTERMLFKGIMPHPMLQFPVVPGYETVGQVVEAGQNARDWLNRRVYVGGNYGFVGVNPAFGGQSQFIVAPASHLTALQSLTDEQGVLLALAATALHGVDVAGIQPAGQQDDPTRPDELTTLVLGQGIVGQLAARFAKARGAVVHVTDQAEARLRHSVADAIVPAEPPPPGPPGPGTYDVLIDATGKMEAIASHLLRVKKGGRVVLLGYYDRVDLPYMPAFLRELTFAVSKEWAPGDLARARDAIAGGLVDVSNLITHRLPADEAPRAFELAFNDPQCLKMVLVWE